MGFTYLLTTHVLIRPVTYGDCYLPTPLTTAASAYHRQLLNCPEGLEWHHNRGLTDATIRRFQLGWITDPLTPEAERNVGCPVIPYVTLSGRVVELRVRREGKPKYLRIGHEFPIPLEMKAHLFNARHAMPTPRSDEVFVVEGEYDCMIAVQAGLRAVAVAGVTNWNPVWCNLLTSSSVAIALDGDESGSSGAVALARTLAANRIDARVVDLPEGRDITDLWLEGGREAVRHALGADLACAA